MGEESFPTYGRGFVGKGSIVFWGDKTQKTASSSIDLEVAQNCQKAETYIAKRSCPNIVYFAGEKRIFGFNIINWHVIL